LNVREPAPPGLHWVIFCALLGLASLVAQVVPSELIDWQPVRAWAEPWRWWTAAFVHYSPMHLVANLGACAVVGAYGGAARLPPRWTWAWVGAWPLVHLALLVVPDLDRYGGLSGLLHAGVAIACIGLMWRDRGRRQVVGLAVLAGMLVKLLLERPWDGAVQHWPEWDIGVAPIAHVTGAVAGAACALVACVTSRRGSRSTIRNPPEAQRRRTGARKSNPRRPR
jgi:rhomboid family GlyGly-CTERM serine protease